MAPERPKANGATVKPSKPIHVASVPAAHRQATLKRASRSMEELLEELGAGDLDVETGGGRDELSETGVRHLSVSVVHRKSPLERLLSKVGRRKPA